LARVGWWDPAGQTLVLVLKKKVLSHMTAPPSLLQFTNFLDTPVRLIFPVLFRACTIFCLLLWWWPKAPSKRLGIAQNPKTHTQPKNCGPDFSCNSTISSPINRILNNLHRLISPALFGVYTILYALLWWWPKAPSNRKPNHGTRNAHRISLTVPPFLLRLTEFLYNVVRLIFPVLFRVYTI